MEDAEYLNRRSLAPGEAADRSRSTRPPTSRAVLRRSARVHYGQQDRPRQGRRLHVLRRRPHPRLGVRHARMDREAASRASCCSPPTSAVTTRRSSATRSRCPAPVDHVITESTYGNTQARPDRAGRAATARRGEVVHRSTAAGCSSRRSRSGGRRRSCGTCRSSSARSRSRRSPSSSTARWASRSAAVHSQFRENYDEETSAADRHEGSVRRVAASRSPSSSQQSRQINAISGPCVIIASRARRASSAASCTTSSRAWRTPNDLVMFVGWTPPGTLGRRLQDGQKRVRIFDRGTT